MLALLLIISKWLGLLGMIVAGVTGLLGHGVIAPTTHYLYGMISTFVLVAAQTMTVFYFIGMSRAVLRAAQEHNLPETVRSEAVSLKRRVTGRGYIVLLLAAVMLVTSGGTLFERLPAWIHYTLALLTIALGTITGVAEFTAFRLNAAFYDRVAEQTYTSTGKPDVNDIG